MLLDEFSEWNRTVSGSIFLNMEELEYRVQALEIKLEEDPTEEVLLNYKKVSSLNTKQLQIAKDKTKKQHTISGFLRGDRNTKLFHSNVKDRRS
nr:uncharacterized protein LOC109178127 [Ipomoea batatas]